MKVVTREVKLILPDSIDDKSAKAHMDDLLRELIDVELEVYGYGLVEGEDVISKIDYPDPEARPYGPPEWEHLTEEQHQEMDKWADKVYAWQRHAEAIAAHHNGQACPRWSHASMHEYEGLDQCPLCKANIAGETL